jgi:glycosyltransferase involved in cell wall biosynthesis
MPRRRILVYTHALVGGGAERVLALVATALRERGHDVTFAVDFEAPQNRPYLDPAIPYHVLGKPHGVAVRALAALLRANAYDLVLAGVGASNAKVIAARLLAGWRGGLVLSAHGRYDAEYGRLGRATYSAVGLTSRLSDRTVAVSDDLRRYLVHHFRADARRAVTIHNAVLLPPPVDVPDAAGLAARENLVLAVGRLVPEKHMEAIIRAVAGGRANASLAILGDGPERARLQAEAARLGVSDRVAFAGYVPEPWAWFRRAKMLALASSTEAFGNVLVEALGHGLPVVSTRCGGPAEVLGEGRFGRLVPIGDGGALMAAIDATLANPGDPAAHRARAEVFSVDAATDAFERLFEAVLAERGIA